MLVYKTGIMTKRFHSLAGSKTRIMTKHLSPWQGSKTLIMTKHFLSLAGVPVPSALPRLCVRSCVRCGVRATALPARCVFNLGFTVEYVQQLCLLGVRSISVLLWNTYSSCAS